MLYCSIVCCPIRTSEVFVRVIILILRYVHVLVIALSLCVVGVVVLCRVGGMFCSVTVLFS